MEGSINYSKDKNMEKNFKKGDVVVFNFPFSDTNNSKKRPALIVANTKDENLILCQITSQKRPDPDIITLDKKDFQEGGLKHQSFIRPTIIFSIDNKRINYKAGSLKKNKIKNVENRFCEIFTR